MSTYGTERWSHPRRHVVAWHRMALCKKGNHGNQRVLARLHSCFGSANGFPSLGLPFVSLTDVSAMRIILSQPSISPPSEGKSRRVGESGEGVLPKKSNALN